MNTEPGKSILIVDDDEECRISLSKILAKEGYPVESAENGARALEMLREKPYSLVVTDLKMAQMDGLELLKAARLTHEDTQVILVTAYGTVETAVEAMKFGAYDFISKPLKRTQILKVVTGALEKRSLLAENRALKSELDSIKTGQSVIGSSPRMREAMEMVLKVAPTDSTVLLEGESGTGKEIVAHAIHHHSQRREKPFLKMSCAALPETLLEAELFGYEKGAFTGAFARKTGRFEAAHEGSLLLDEVGEISQSVQVKLLRMLEQGEVQRLGAARPLNFNVRVIAATNRDLEESVRSKQFREDLYYRLNVVKIRIPPLRERREDLPLLAGHFLKLYSGRNQKNITGITEDAMETLLRYSWPGNVRELENTIERAVVLSAGQMITKKDLPEALLRSGAEVKSSLNIPVGTPLKEVEELLIEETLKKTQGDKSLAAKLLGINPRTIYRKIKGDE